MEKHLSNTLLFRGVGTFTFGLVALCYPGDGIAALAVPFGTLVSISGLVTLFHYAPCVTFWQRTMFRKGVSELIIGVVTLLGVVFSVPLFVAMLAVWVLMTGGVLIARFRRLTPQFAEASALVAAGWATLLFGGYLIASLALPAMSLTYEIAVFALLFGGTLLYGYTKLKESGKYLGYRRGDTHSSQTTVYYDRAYQH